MDLIKLLIIATLFGGNMAFASISTDSSPSEDFAMISSWMAHLNYFYPDLQLSYAEQTFSTIDPVTTLRDLEALEDILSGSKNTETPLVTLACNRAVCGGGGTGKCTTCD